jgi:hypothetical protein
MAVIALIASHRMVELLVDEFERHCLIWGTVLVFGGTEENHEKPEANQSPTWNLSWAFLEYSPGALPPEPSFWFGEHCLEVWWCSVNFSDICSIKWIEEWWCEEI